MDFLKELGDIASSVVDAMDTGVKYLNSVDFTQTAVFKYLGYFRWVMGDINYFAFTSTIIIGLAVTIWTYTLKGLNYLKTFLPW